VTGRGVSWIARAEAPVDSQAPIRALTPAEVAQRAAMAITERFPDCKVWTGKATGRCWAYVPGKQPRLVEAGTFRELAGLIARAKGFRAL
jgi:hypothetical protein